MGLSHHEKSIIEKIDLIEFSIPEYKKELQNDAKWAGGFTLLLSGVSIGLSALGLEAIDDGREITSLYLMLSSAACGFFSVAAGVHTTQKIKEYYEISVQEAELLLEQEN